MSHEQVMNLKNNPARVSHLQSRGLAYNILVPPLPCIPHSPLSPPLCCSAFNALAIMALQMLSNRPGYQSLLITSSPPASLNTSCDSCVRSAVQPHIIIHDDPLPASSCLILLVHSKPSRSVGHVKVDEQARQDGTVALIAPCCLMHVQS